MRVIARKRKGVVGHYAFLTVLGAVMFTISLLKNSSEMVICGLLGIVTFAAGLILLIGYLKLPNDIISVDESSGRIYLHKENINVSALSVSDVSYTKSRLRTASFKWGTVTITTPNSVYEYQDVDDCEQVAKVLLRIVYSHQNQ